MGEELRNRNGTNLDFNDVVVVMASEHHVIDQFICSWESALQESVGAGAVCALVAPLEYQCRLYATLDVRLKSARVAAVQSRRHIGWTVVLIAEQDRRPS